jgi:hypothetical protein
VARGQLLRANEHYPKRRAGIIPKTTSTHTERPFVRLYATHCTMEETMDAVKSQFPEMREEDWKRMNDADAQRATLVFEQRKEQL